ncbi:uncharacterized protein LOC135466610 [Liolophura sinensis]|uniref:uncharacterized protein LOC135466610 n=1 Tax=Liolophura sinensis TaxID=3198878 RepID=UPI0031589529
MGQTSSQEIEPSVSPVKKAPAPPRPQEPPKLQLAPRLPSYAVPENKVLPTELPSRPLRAVSSPFSKSNADSDELSVDKENKPLENGSVNLDHNFFPEDQTACEISDQDSDVNSVKGREKYKAPSPPTEKVLPVNSQGHVDNIFLDPFYNRAALAHRRTNSLDRLPASRVNGHPRRPISAVNLTSSEHTIFEDPEEANQNNKYTSLPQKSTFPMDYSYAVTYAQLAGHRRKKVQTKLESEKEILLKQQSLPELKGKKDMEPSVDMYVTHEGEIDLDSLTPKKKKYKAPAPPSTPKVSKHAVILHTHNSGRPIKTAHAPVSSHKKVLAPAEPPVEPPVDYDTDEIVTHSVTLQNQSVQPSYSNGIDAALKSPPKMSEVERVSNGKERISNGIGRAVDSPISVDIKIVGLPMVPSEKVSEKKVTQNPVPLGALRRQMSGADPVSPTSPKSPPPPVKPKPLRSPDEGRFTFPSVPGKLDTDVVTVNGQIIPEVPMQDPVQNEVVSLSIDCKSKIVKSAVASPPVTISPVASSLVVSPVVTTAPVISSPKATPPVISPPVAPVVPGSIVIHPVINLSDRNGIGVPKTSPEVHPIQRENRSTIHLSSEGKTNLIRKQNSVDVEVTNPQHACLNAVISGHEREVNPVINNSKSEIQVNSRESVQDNVGNHLHEERTKDSSFVTADIKPIPLGLTADIILEKSTVCENNPATLPQSQSGSESGVAMLLSDQSFESLTTGDRSMDVVVAEGEEEPLSSEGQVSQGTMTIVPSDMVDRVVSLSRSVSTSSSDSAKPMSPPLTPDDSQHPKMNSLLQNDIVAAAQVRVLKLKKPATAPPPPKDPEEVFKEELAKIHKEREVRITRNLSRDKDTASSGTESDQHQGEASTRDVMPDKDNDSGIQACSFSEDWTPEHDLEDSDDENRSVLTSRSGMFYDGREAKTNKPKVKPSNSMSSNARVKVLRKSDSDATDKFGSLRRFRDNVHKSVKHALSSVNRPSSKPSKLDKRSSLPVPAPTTAELKQPVFRKLDPDAEQQPSESKISENGQHGTHTDSEQKPSKEESSKDSDQQVTKKAGVAYVSGNGQIVLLPEFETVTSPSKPETEDGHRAPKRWKKMKKFAYMATTRKKEKQKMEQLLRERVEEQERRMEAERQKQMEMEKEFMKVRQVDKPILKAHLDDDSDYPIRNENVSKTTSPREVPPKKSEPLQNPQGQVTVNGTAQGKITQNDAQPYAVTSFSMPGLVQAPGVMANGQPVVSPIILTGNGHAYNPWLPTQPVQNPAYPASMGWGISNYPQYPATSLPYDLTNYMQMLDISGQSVPVNNGLMNGFSIPTQSQVNSGIQYNGTTNYTVMNPVHFQQPNSVEANNYNNKRSLKQTIYVNPNTVDDSVLNQMYAEYQNGNSQQSRKERKKTSNPLYYSSDEEEEYDVSDVHTGHTHSKGTVARISVPDHHIHPPHYDGGDAEMSSPCSIASSSADSGSPYPVKFNGAATQSARFRSGSTSDTVNLDESYSSADR